MSTKQHIKFLPMALAISLLFSWNAQADFTLSGTTITQSGTDADLSKLSGVSGVTVTTQDDFTVYNIGNRQLNITGTLSIDPEEEQLIVGYDGATYMVYVTGTLNIGREITENGFTRYSEGLAIYLEDTPLDFVSRFTFASNATLNWNGGIINMHSGRFDFLNDTVTVRINSSNAKLIYRTRSPNNQIRQETDDFISTAFSFIGGELTIVGTGQQLNGYEPTHCTGALIFSGATPNVDIKLRDYAGGGRGNLNDVKFWSGPRPYLINSASGTELNAGPHISGNNSSFGIARVFQELSVNVKEFNGGNIQGANMYFQDYDNGFRRLYNQEAPNIDLTGTLTYTGTSDANGNIASQEILTGAVVADLSYGASSDAINTGMYAWDYRSKNGNTTDLFDLNIFSYNHAILTIPDVELKGVGGTQVNAIMFVDDQVSQTTKATVDAYTEIANLDQLYDRAKSWKVDTANVNYPTLSTQPISASSTALDLGSRSLVVDANATAAFALNKTTHTITIKASTLQAGTKFTSITTTGTISTANNATLEFGYTHSGGTQKYLELTGLTSADISVMNNQPATAVSLGSATNQTGTYKLSFAAPTDASDIQIEVTRTGYTTWTEQFPENDLSLMRNVLQYQNVPLAAKQVDMINYALRIMQKEEAINAALNGTTPTVTVTTNTTPATDVATETNQDAILALLKRILVKSAANREALKEQ